MTQMVLDKETKEIKFKDDPLFSFIVPIYDIKPMVLKRCLMSLVDQDYSNMEIVCVFDGENSELMNIAKQFEGKKDLKIIQIEHQGACAARNAGFKESKGEIVSFFNSDYIAKPGMVRMWVDKMIDHPECGFVYGGYEYNTVTSAFYNSKPFDEWELQVANFIDCGFPLWRKYAVEWDTNCKSLQDWDFWVRVVKEKKVKGFYLDRDYSFLAEPPRPNGLSDDSSSNWIDRVNYVKSKNGIPLRDILVTSEGAKNHAVQIAKLIDGDFRDDTFDKPSAYKALYMIGFYIKPNEPALNEHARKLAIFKEKYPKAKRIVHFVGADIYWIRKFPWESLKYLAGALRQSCDHILSENQLAHDELEAFGIPSEIVPIPSYSEWEVKPLPKDFKVSLYLVEPGRGYGQSDFDKYLYEHTLSIVRGMPDIQFTAYGHGGQDLSYPNLKHYGLLNREQYKEYVYENSCLLRIVRHDTKPLASNEFMLSGRNVISNIPNENTIFIDSGGTQDLNKWDRFGEGFNAYNWPSTKKEIIKKIRALKKEPKEVPSELILSIKKTMDQKNYITKIKELCNV